ncbi:cytochrome c biogenesis protein CcdA [soil metagenome]
MIKTFTSVLVALFLACAPTLVTAQNGKDHITFQPIAPVSAKAGDTVVLHIKAKIQKHWHTYGMTAAIGPDGLGPEPTVVAVQPTSVIKTIGKIKPPKTAHSHFDETWGTNIEEWSGTVELDVPVRIDPRSKKGLLKAQVKFTIQMCDTMSCLPLDDILLPVAITVTAEASSAVLTDTTTLEPTAAAVTTQSAKVAAAPTTVQAPTAAPTEIESEKKKGLLSFFLYAMGIGFLALLTPCVFPMIPITVSFFTKRHEKTRGKGLRDSSIFALGIISTFTAIGIIASVIFGGTAVQDLAANPWLNLGIGLLFMALAFNLFGAFEIQVPVSIMNKLNQKSQGDGVTSVWLMGLTFSLTSFTCTVPFVGTLLLSASNGDFLYPAVGTLGFSTAFAMPFFVLSLFPALLNRLPRAGGWMNNLKVVMGFLEIAAAIKFFSTAEFVWGIGLLPREIFLAIWAGCAFLIALYVLGVFEMKLDSTIEKVSGIRAFYAVVFVSLGIWLVAGMLGRPLASDIEALLPPDNYHELIEGAALAAPPLSSTAGEAGKAVQDSEYWYDDLSKAKAEAAKTGKPIFIDFTGFSCTNCRWMEKFMFPKQSTRSRFEKMILVRLYTDRKSQPYIGNQDLMRGYGTVANPLYVTLNSKGVFVAQGQYTRSEATFLAFLDKALQ